MTSLSKNARVAGLLYILSSLFGIVRLIYIPGALLVTGARQPRPTISRRTSCSSA